MHDTGAVAMELQSDPRAPERVRNGPGMLLKPQSPTLLTHFPNKATLPRSSQIGPLPDKHSNIWDYRGHSYSNYHIKVSEGQPIISTHGGTHGTEAVTEIYILTDGPTERAWAWHGLPKPKSSPPSPPVSHFFQ